MVLNSAFVFVKPHAVTPAAQALVKEQLQSKGLKITAEGSIAAEEIDKKMLIDQHYYAIASKATILKPHELNIPSAKFEEKFGISWQAALDQGVVYNALDACAKLGIDANTLDGKWGEAKKADKLIKFGGGFYCGIVDGLYVFNGFFMSMRQKFVEPGVSIYYFVVEWESQDLAWADFRGKVLGPTDPTTAPEDSIRGLIYAKWQELGLKAQPDVGDNGVHASASPFEALAERTNWLGVAVSEDAFGKVLLEAGLDADTIKAWSVDPQVTYGEKTGSLFDALEDQDSDAVVAKLLTVQK